MRIFTQQYIVGIYRQVYTGGKSVFSVVQTTNGYLHELSPEVASANGFQYGYGAALICEYGTDIRVTDKVLMGTQTTAGYLKLYTVKGVAQYGAGRLPTDYVKAIITLPES